MTSEQKNTAQVQNDQGGTEQTSAIKFSYPPTHSVKGRVLGALLRGEFLTHRDCWNRFGSSRLAHHILRLRSIGWPVETTDQRVETSDAGRRATIGLYFLPPEAISDAGQIAQDYAKACARIEAERRAA